MFPPSSSLAARLSAVFFVLATFTAVVVPVTPAQSQIYPITFPIASGYEDQVTWSDTYGAPRSGGRTHIGVDLLGPKMIPLVAANDGVVTWGRFDNSRGTIVRFRDANGWEYQYIHINNDTPGTDDGRATCAQALSAKLCASLDGDRLVSGTELKAGEVIGFMGDSGNAEATPPHLHFEIYQPNSSGGVTAINPTRFVDAAFETRLAGNGQPVGPFEDVRVAAEQVYSRLEGRDATAGEQAVLAEAVSQGGLARALADAVTANPSAGMVDRLYLAFFQRPPDDDGWDHWIEVRSGGLQLEEIAESFAQSEEFERRYGSVNFSVLLDRLYADVLGRAPDAEGKAYWLDLLDRGEVSRGTIVVYFTESAEFRRAARGRTELTVVNRVLELERPTAAEITAWNRLRSTTDLETAVSGLLAG